MTSLAISEPDDGDCRIVPIARPQGRSIAAFEWRDEIVDLGAFTLESGETLSDPYLHIRLHGRDGRPVIIAAGGVSAGRMVADADDIAGWWRAIANPDGAIDASRFQIFGFDFLPGDESGLKTITPADQARAVKIALDKLGVVKIHAFVGASYGGCVGLSFASLYPEMLKKLCVISAAAKADPMTTALRGVQRRIIKFAQETGREKEGVALARELAMTTYRTGDEFRDRFRSEAKGARPGDPYDVCEYLESRGRAYAEKMSANRYLTLSDSLDRANADAERITAECLFIAATTDRLVPAADTENTSRCVKGPARYLAVESRVGHDAFLCDTQLFETQLKRFLTDKKV